MVNKLSGANNAFHFDLLKFVVPFGIEPLELSSIFLEIHIVHCFPKASESVKAFTEVFF